MSLATRCPACGTIFRVVQDQLKVSEGWVRCGQCHEVFHGIEALFDLDSDPGIAARRASARTQPPTTRVFAESRASSPVPLPPAPPPPTVFAPPPQPTAFAPTAPIDPAPTSPMIMSSPLPPASLARRSPIAIPARAPAPMDSGRSVSATPSAFGPASLPPSTFDAPATGHSGFAPVPPPPTPFVARGTIAPRFAARLAEESARAQAAAPLGSPAPAPLPARIEPSWAAPAPAVDLSDAPMAFEPAPAPVLAAEPTYAPAPAYVREPTYAPAPLLPPVPAPAPQPAPAPFRVAVVGRATAPAAPPEPDGSTLPSRLADDADDEGRAGPPTLASLLPEDAGEWPPRKTRKPRDQPSSELALVDPRKDPRFLREARSGARWRKPWVRAVLSLALLLLVAGAAGQLAWPQRDMLASRWPVARPAWDWLCEQAGCRIEAPRALSSLALDGSSLTRTDTEHVLLFSADLHNRSDHEVRMPSFDLSFMDLNGEIVARKVLTPAQIGIAMPALPPDGELHVHARLQVGGLDATGFQADLFYP